MHDLVVEIPNEPGALATVAKAISDAGVNAPATSQSDLEGLRRALS